MPFRPNAGAASGQAPGRPRGKFTADKVCKAIGQLLPENAIIVDEAQTSGIMLPMYTSGAPRHDVLTLTGGAIGQGLPNAVGAAIACPDRKVIALAGDGSAMYTIQALWTMAREKLDVISIIFNNRSYAILNVELRRVGAAAPATRPAPSLTCARRRLILCNWPRHGRSARRATTTEEFLAAFEHALRTPGPHLIEAIVPPDAGRAEAARAAAPAPIAGESAAADCQSPQAQACALKSDLWEFAPLETTFRPVQHAGFQPGRRRCDCLKPVQLTTPHAASAGLQQCRAV
jgi:thiamine pyrophosphate-dependent acetolactate synthase large subunit-like protein